MVNYYLEKVLSNIEKLIELTTQDIEDIKNAKNEEIYKRTKIKDEVIALFESEKALLDNELVKLVKSNEGVELSELLDESAKNNLDNLKMKLQELKDVNKKYAKLVVAVNEFYTKLFDQIFPTEMENYKKINPKSFSLLKVSA